MRGSGPVWHLIGRLSEVMGGTGYHRVRLIDAAVANFGSWWLRGTKGTAGWGFGLQDITNYYLLQGVRGGISTMVAFIAVLVLSFKGIGLMLDRTRGVPPGRGRRAARVQEKMVWGWGVCLTAHCVTFISISYFGNVQLLFFLILASAAAMMDLARRGRKGASTRDSADVDRNGANSRKSQELQVEQPEPETSNSPDARVGANVLR